MSKNREMVKYILNPQKKYYTDIKNFKHVGRYMPIRSQ